MPTLYAYRDAQGRQQFDKWFNDLDAQAARKVRAALAQIEAGNMSEVKPVGAGVSERRIHWGKGLRIYFASDGKRSLFCLAAVPRRHKAATLNAPLCIGMITSNDGE
jgi:putative addiction module killer protein